MRISRLYISEPLIEGSTLFLPDDVSHYAKNVLRMKLGDQCLLFNGTGGEFHAEVTLITKKAMEVVIGKHRSLACESPLALHLALGVSRGERMSFAIQKSVELGIASIQPLMMERTVVQLKGEKLIQRQQHWQKISQGASEQCGRERLVPIAEPTSLAEWLVVKEACTGIILDPAGDVSSSTIEFDSNLPVYLCIGPEGGFSELERELLYSSGFQGMRLGPRILRTETAVLAAITALQSRFGDLQ